MANGSWLKDGWGPGWGPGAAAGWGVGRRRPRGPGRAPSHLWAMGHLTLNTRLLNLVLNNSFVDRKLTEYPINFLKTNIDN